MSAPLPHSQPSTERLLERCEAYKGQVEAGASEIAALKARIEELESDSAECRLLAADNFRRAKKAEAALREIDQAIADLESTMTLPGPKELKIIWAIARTALQPKAGS